MSVVSYIVFYIVGLVMGMFLYTCIHRIPREEKFFCNPFIIKNKYSYIFSGITGFLFLGVFLKYTTFLAIKFTILISLLIVIGIIDYKTTDVYVRTTVPGMALGLLFIAIGSYFKIPPGEYIIVGVISGAILALIHVISGGGIGGGDAEVLLICGLFLGLKMTMLLVVISFTMAATLGLILILLKKRNLKDSMPFVPFISIATIIIIFVNN